MTSPQEKVFWARQKLRHQHIDIIAGMCDMLRVSFVPKLTKTTFEELMLDHGCISYAQMASELALRNIEQIEPVIAPLLQSSAKHLQNDSLDSL